MLRQVVQFYSGVYNIKLNFRYDMQMSLSMQKESYTRTHQFFILNMSRRRASLLLIGLKRYQNKNDVWPETLEQIKPLVSPISFNDPASADKFIYKLTGNEFTLYSIGFDSIDNNGESVNRYKRKSGEPDDVVFWPSTTRKNTKSSTPFSP